MIPRFLVPVNARPPAATDGATQRRRPTTLDERTLVPAMLPIIRLDGQSKIPSSLPLESISARVVVPRDLNPEAFVAVEEANALPLQPTDMDARVAVPQGAPPEKLEEIETLPLDMVEADIFMTGEVNLLAKEPVEDKSKWSVVTRASSMAFHILVIALIILQPKLFPYHPPSQAQLDLARRQITVLLPPGALDELKPAPRPKDLIEKMRVDPRVLKKIAPPLPTPPPPKPPEPERVVKDLPNAPVPQQAVKPPQPTESAKSDAPKPPLKLDLPDAQPTPRGLIIPKSSSPGQSIQDSLRAAKPNAPAPVGGGGRLPSSGVPGSGSQGSAYGSLQMLTPDQGVDFRDYLQRVYVTVKRNWFAVMPASVELGDKGVVSLQFRILRNGGVPDGEPVTVFGSGKEPLDRAAISSIRTSNPFEPLPPAFSGPYIELRFTYYYNLRPENFGQQ